MLVKYYDPHITQDVFRDIWMEYTKFRLTSCRISMLYKIQVFIQGVEYTAMFHREWGAAQLAIARLDNTLGRENAGIRKYRAFRHKYLKEIQEIWRDYYIGIARSELPYDSKNKFKKFSWWSFSNEMAETRAAQMFFIRYAGKDIRSLLKPRYKAVAPFILERNFDGFFESIGPISKRQWRHFHNGQPLQYLLK